MPEQSFMHSVSAAIGESIQWLSTMSGTTLVIAAVMAVLAVIVALKAGFRNKTMPIGKPKGKPGKWAWIAVAVLWVVVMLNYFDRQVLAFLKKSVTDGAADGISMTDAQFGLLTSAFLIVYALLSPLGGYLADRYSRKFIILCSLVVWSAVTWMTGRAETYGELIFWRGAMGVSEALYIPAALALITDYHRGSTRSLAVGLHMSGIYTGQILAGYGAWIASDPACMLGWRLTFETFGFIGVAYALVVIVFLHDPKPAKQEVEVEETADVPKAISPSTESVNFGFTQVMKSLFNGRAMYMLMVMYACAGFANWFLLTWYPSLLQDMFNISESEAGEKAGVWINVAKYAAVLIAGVVADMWCRRNANARAYVPGICYCVAGPCVLLAMMPVLGLLPAFSLGVTVALVATQGMAQGSLDATLMPVVRSQINERFSATGYGMLNFISAAVGASTSWLGGFLNDIGVPLGVTLCIAGVLMVVCGLFFFFLPTAKNA